MMYVSELHLILIDYAMPNASRREAPRGTDTVARKCQRRDLDITALAAVTADRSIGALPLHMRGPLVMIKRGRVSP